MMAYVYLLFLCVSTIALMEHFHYYANVEDVKTEAEDVHKTGGRELNPILIKFPWPLTVQEKVLNPRGLGKPPSWSSNCNHLKVKLDGVLGSINSIHKGPVVVTSGQNHIKRGQWSEKTLAKARKNKDLSRMRSISY